MDKKLSWDNSAGGSMGRNDILKIGDDYVGHFYTDASEGVDAPEVLAEMARRYNAHAALVEALKDARFALYGNGPGNPKIDAAILAVTTP